MKNSESIFLPSRQNSLILQMAEMLFVVAKHRKLLHRYLGISQEDIISENPFYQTCTLKQPDCQIDYMVESFKTAASGASLRFKRLNFLSRKTGHLGNCLYAQSLFKKSFCDFDFLFLTSFFAPLLVAFLASCIHSCG
jgi:hypothetical protein